MTRDDGIPWQACFFVPSLSLSRPMSRGHYQRAAQHSRSMTFEPRATDTRNVGIGSSAVLVWKPPRIRLCRPEAPRQAPLRWLLLFARSGRRTDASGQRGQLLTEFWNSDFDTCVGSITALPFPDDSFDGLFYWYSTIHTPNGELGTVFAEARRALRPEVTS